jgi:N-acetylglucosaminyldiphosphoundecaprenol N-acetyl-beta-D-mannosaminyltransferase
MSESTLRLFDYTIYTGARNITHGHPISKRLLISTINPNAFYVAERDAAFKAALIQSEVLLPDGIGIVLGAAILKGRIIRKFSGTDLLYHLLDQLDKCSSSEVKKVFFLGSSEKVLDGIRRRIKLSYPTLIVEVFSPPFSQEFSAKENSRMIEAVNSFSPYVLFVGMTAPKQEKWAHQQRGLLNAQIICSIGAAFDFFSGSIARPGPVLRSLGLEWLGRLVKEPRRMWRRNLISLPYYLKRLIQEMLSIQNNQKPG